MGCHSPSSHTAISPYNYSAHEWVFIKEDQQCHALSGSLVWPAFEKFTKMGFLWLTKRALTGGPSAFVQVSCSNKRYMPWRSQPQLAPTWPGLKLHPGFWLLSTCTSSPSWERLKTKTLSSADSRGKQTHLSVLEERCWKKLKKLKINFANWKGGEVREEHAVKLALQSLHTLLSSQLTKNVKLILLSS